jgi:hypothetical protein
MVKNTKGGNKSKGIARKHITGAREARALRLSTSELEKYGVITKLLGEGMFYVVTDISTDAQPHLLGHIRKKFKGRSKRDNTITLGSVILIGLREWEGPNYKKCDLLEVYDANEVRQLMTTPSVDITSLHRYIDMYNSASGEATDSGYTEIVFTEERDYTDGLIPDMPEETPEACISGKEEIVDIEEI